MARLELVTEQQATGKVKEIYEDIKSSMGWDMVPQTFQLIAHNPTTWSPTGRSTSRPWPPEGWT